MTQLVLIAPCCALPIIWPGNYSVLQAGRRMAGKPFHVAGWQTYGRQTVPYYRLADV